jgi:hypothetical protein
MLPADSFNSAKFIQLEFNYLDQLSIILNNTDVFFKQKEFGMNLIEICY